MNITKVTSQRIEPGSHGLVVAAHIEGDDLEPRAVPLIVKFGAVVARSVMPLLEGKGVRAVFSQMPPPGAPLSIGYLDGELEETEFEFEAPEDAPIV